MCELYLHSRPDASRRHPLLGAFLAHAAKPFDNPDGWGLAFHHGDDAQLFHEPVAASDSALAAWLARNPPAAATVVGHLRKATSGAVGLANTQPLSRVVTRRGGGAWRLVFAHNGGVAGFKDSAAGRALAARALGSADSEIALLDFIGVLAGRSLAEAWGDVLHFAARMAGYGPFNVVATDGRDSFAFSDRRAHAADGPDAPLREPGLFLHGFDKACVLTSEPMADVPGTAPEPLPRGSWLRLREGEVVARGRLDLPPPS